MVEVIHIPPRPLPKRETAHYYPKTLGEHFLAFLNTNNKNGFLDKDDSTDGELPNLGISLESANALDHDAIAHVFLIVATKDELTLREFKDIARHLSVTTKRKIPLHKAREVLARLLGYKRYDSMYFHAFKKITSVRGKDLAPTVQILKKRFKDHAVVEIPDTKRARQHPEDYIRRARKKAFEEAVIIANLRDKSMINMRFIHDFVSKKN